MYLGVFDHAGSSGNVLFHCPCFLAAARLLEHLLPALQYNSIFPGVIGPPESNGRDRFCVPCFSGAAGTL